MLREWIGFGMGLVWSVFLGWMGIGPRLPGNLLNLAGRVEDHPSAIAVVQADDEDEDEVKGRGDIASSLAATAVRVDQFITPVVNNGFGLEVEDSFDL